MTRKDQGRPRKHARGMETTEDQGEAKGRHRRPRKQSKREKDQGETKEDQWERLIDDQENPYKLGETPEDQNEAEGDRRKTNIS